jgi:hypothetical protein
MQHAAAATDDGNEPPSCTAPSEAPADTAETEGILYMPTDTIAERRTPGVGVMLMQRP